MSRYTELMAVMLEEFCEADTFHAVFHRDSRKYLRTDRERIRDQGDAALAFLRKKLARELWCALYETKQMHSALEHIANYPLLGASDWTRANAFESCRRIARAAID